MDITTMEQDLHEAAERLVAPGSTECLSCYLARMLSQHGCAAHRFTRLWARDRTRGTEDGLVRWASALGGCCCDCEVLMNALSKPVAERRGGVLCEVARRIVREGEGEAVDGPEPPCGGVSGRRRPAVTTSDPPA